MLLVWVSAKNIMGPRSARAAKAGASAAHVTARTVEVSMSKTQSTLHWVSDGASVCVAVSGQEAEKVVNYRTPLLRQADRDAHPRWHVRSTIATTLRYSILQRLLPLLLLYCYDSSTTAPATTTVTVVLLKLLRCFFYYL